MKLQYLSAMQQHGFTEAELSHGIRKIVAKLKKIVAAMDDEQASLATVTDEDDRAEMTENISRAKETIKEIDADLVAKINKYAPNREKYMQMGKTLMAARGKSPAAPAAPAPATPEPVQPPAPAAPASATPAASGVGADDEKKSSNVLGWAFGLLAVGVCAYFGIDYYQNRR